VRTLGWYAAKASIFGVLLSLCFASVYGQAVGVRRAGEPNKAGGDYNNTVRLLLLHRPNLAAAFGLPRSGYTLSWASPAPATLRGNGDWHAMALPRRFHMAVITNDNWGGGAGNWSTGPWSAGVPTANNNVFIDNGHVGASPVALDVSGGLNNLTIDSDDSLSFNNNTVLTVSGTSIANAGAITINSAGNVTELLINSANVTLSGAGTLTMGNNAQNYIFGSVGTNVLTNQSTIQGSGQIGNNSMGLVNSGTINANQATPLNILDKQRSNQHRDARGNRRRNFESDWAKYLHQHRRDH
jgi:hypothetical protein